MSSAEAQRAPVTIVECLLAGVAYVTVAVTLPGLARVTRLPQWTLICLAGYVGLAVVGWRRNAIHAVRACC